MKKLKKQFIYINSIDGGYVGWLKKDNRIISQGETLKELETNLIEAERIMKRFEDSLK